MFGVLFFLIIIIGCFANSCKTDYESNKRREQSRQNGSDTYFDYNGKCRLVSNNHQIDRTIRVVNGELDHVLIDTKTEQILHNYSEDERNAEKQKVIELRNKNEEAKNKARTKGEYKYVEVSKTPISSGFYEDFSDIQFGYCKNIYRKRRVSDDLLLSKTCDYRCWVDARCNFGLWSQNAEKQNDIERLRELAASNWKKILRWESNREYWKEKSPYPTKEEAEAYAKKIGAYLPDTIRNGEPLLTFYDESCKEVYNFIATYDIGHADLNNYDTLGFTKNLIEERLIKLGYLVEKDEIGRILITTHPQNMKGE